MFKLFNNLGNIVQIDYRSISTPNYPLARFTGDFESIVRVNDNISSSNINLSGASFIIGDRFGWNTPFYDLVHRTGKSINTVAVTARTFTADDKTLYTFLLPKQLKQNYVYELDTARNSSVGLVLNGAIRKLIRDTLAIYYNYCQNFEFSGDVPEYTVSILLKELKVDDFLLYSNESINTSTLNRIINRILEIQNTIAVELS